jgi:hypothetical protein
MIFGGITAYKKEESKLKYQADQRKFFNNIFNDYYPINVNIKYCYIDCYG